MFNKKLCSLVLCGSLLGNSLWGGMKEMSFGRIIVVGGLTVYTLNKIYMKIWPPESKDENHKGKACSTLCSLGFLSAVYDYPLTYPLLLVESGVYKILTGGYAVLSGIYHAPTFCATKFVSGASMVGSGVASGLGTVGEAIITLNPYVVGFAAGGGLGVGAAVYYYKKKKKPIALACSKCPQLRMENARLRNKWDIDAGKMTQTQENNRLLREELLQKNKQQAEAEKRIAQLEKALETANKQVTNLSNYNRLLEAQIRTYEPGGQLAPPPYNPTT